MGTKWTKTGIATEIGMLIGVGAVP